MHQDSLKIIIFVSYTFPYIGSGIGNVAQMQAESLAKLGHSVVVVSSNIPHTKAVFTKKGVTYIKLKALDFLEKFNIPVPLFFFNAEVKKYFKNADIIHAHGMLYPTSFFAAVLSKIFAKPFVLTQHVGFVDYSNLLINALQKFVHMTMGNLVLILSNKVITVNEAVFKWLNLNKKKAVNQINGVDIKLFHPSTVNKKKIIRKNYNLPVEKAIVLFVGRLVGKKGFRELLLAQNNKYCIVLAGGGEPVEQMKNDNKNIIFLGEITQSKLAEIYQASDIFILPSKGEGFPLSIQEAMASGLPIIVSKHPGYKKYLGKKYVKYITPKHKEIRKAILGVLGDKKLMHKMSSYSRTLAVSKISWETNAKNLLKIYHGLLT